MPPASPDHRRSTPLFAVFLLLATTSLLRPADGAPLTYYGVQLPDPLQVYTLQETKPENIRNDPFLVIFKTHVPSLRPYEIPYFPPKDHLSAEEQDGNALPNNAETSNIAQEQTPVETSPQPAKIQEPVIPETNKVKPDEQIDLDKLPELVELKPEVLLEAIDASKQDAEEGETSRPGDPTELLADAPSDANKETTDKGASVNNEPNDSKMEGEKEKAEADLIKEVVDQKENDTLGKDDLENPTVKKEETDETPKKEGNKADDDKKDTPNKADDDKLNAEDTDRVGNEGEEKQKE